MEKLRACTSLGSIFSNPSPPRWVSTTIVRYVFVDVSHLTRGAGWHCKDGDDAASFTALLGADECIWIDGFFTPCLRYTPARYSRTWSSNSRDLLILTTQRRCWDCSHSTTLFIASYFDEYSFVQCKLGAANRAHLLARLSVVSYSDTTSIQPKFSRVGSKVCFVHLDS